MVSVKDHGAYGDGSHDDTTAIQNTITSFGGIILFPPGTYITSSALQVPSNVTLQGEGPGSIIYCQASTAGTSAINLATDTNHYCMSVRIADLYIQTTNAGVHGIGISDTDAGAVLFYTVVERIRFSNGGKCVYIPQLGIQCRFEHLISSSLKAELIDLHNMACTRVVSCDAEGLVADGFALDTVPGDAAVIRFMGGANTMENCLVEINGRGTAAASFRFGGSLAVGAGLGFN